ncbi:UDP-glucose 4-epimerase family protein [Photobacterium alginatilyticum]|uniref:UDP-glucose 4-epimerase family protein n=1 Tax=Photobacterium alginatilyticum TaxID=1775171 RepID=UPI004068BFB4
MIGITGATGFVGSALTRKLLDSDCKIRCFGRTQPSMVTPEDFFQGELSPRTNYSQFLLNVDAVIHCAARVHIMNNESPDPINEYREINTAGTLNLAKQAADAGVKRFIFISTIKVNGEATLNGQAFTPNDNRLPQDPYGISKSEAEEQLLELAEQTGMEIVIIRPPLVYGPGVKANFASLLNLVSKGLPLPFSCIKSNKRSMVSIDNLVDLIVTCIEHPKAKNQVFLVSDGDDLSTADLILRLSKACDTRGWMLPVPVFVFQLVGKLLGKTGVIERLTGSLQVDITKTKELLEWQPPMSVDEGLKKTADAFLYNKRSK